MKLELVKKLAFFYKLELKMEELVSENGAAFFGSFQLEAPTSSFKLEAPKKSWK